MKRFFFKEKIIEFFDIVEIRLVEQVSQVRLVRQ